MLILAGGFPHFILAWLSVELKTVQFFLQTEAESVFPNI